MDAPGVIDSPVLGRIQFDARCREEVELILREVVEDRSYLRHGLELTPGDTVIDAGANIGVFALYADWACKGSLRLLAFEPIPSTFVWLERNAAEHGLLSRPGIALINAGLTRLGGPGTATFTHFPGLPSNSTLDPEAKHAEMERWIEASLAALPRSGARAFMERSLRAELAERLRSERVECRLTTVSESLAIHGFERVDLLKVDVEGTELDVLDGLDAGTWSRVRQVVVETHGAERSAAVQARLHAAGFADPIAEKPHWTAELGLDNHTVYARRG